MRRLEAAPILGEDGGFEEEEGSLGRFAVDGFLFQGGEDFEAFDDAAEGGVLAVEVGGVAEHEEE